MTIDFSFMKRVLPQIIAFLPVTLKLTVVAFLIAFVVGVLMALAVNRRIKVLSQICRVYMSLIRGTPMLLQIYVIYNLTPYLLAGFFEKTGISYNIYDVNPIWYAYVALSLTASVSVAEAIRAGLQSINKGQREAGLSIGMSERATFLHIVFPQVLCVAMPVIGNIMVDLIKATSLAFMMSVVEITGEAKILGGEVLRYFEAYLCVFIIYIVVISIVERLMRLLEKKVSVYRRGVHSSV